MKQSTKLQVGIIYGYFLLVALLLVLVLAFSNCSKKIYCPLKSSVWTDVYGDGKNVAAWHYSSWKKVSGRYTQFRLNRRAGVKQIRYWNEIAAR